MRAEYEIDNRIGFFIFSAMCSCCTMQPHTAIIWLGLFFFVWFSAPTLPRTRISGVLAHGAGVDDDDVGLKFVLREAVAHLGR